MNVERFVSEFLGENTYLLHDNNQALVIDPGVGMEQPIKARINELNLELSGVLLTHAHPDHIWDSAAIAQEKPVWCPAPDMYRLEDPLGTLGPISKRFKPFATPWVKPKNVLSLPQEAFTSGMNFGPATLRSIPAPGHSEGCTIHLICANEPVSVQEAGMNELFAFCGDVIFAGSIGRTDLLGSDSRQMMHSLRTLANAMDPKTALLPGHGPATTWKQELDNNGYIRQARKEG